MQKPLYAADIAAEELAKIRARELLDAIYAAEKEAREQGEN